MDVATLADLLHETADHHGPFEASSPPHNWWDWYAAYLNARLDGRTSAEATVAAGKYMEPILARTDGPAPPPRVPGRPASSGG
jgi:hypothetical protein